MGPGDGEFIGKSDPRGLLCPTTSSAGTMVVSCVAPAAHPRAPGPWSPLSAAPARAAAPSAPSPGASGSGTARSTAQRDGEGRHVEGVWRTMDWGT